MGVVKSGARELLSAAQLAEYLGCGRTSAHALPPSGEIASFKIGRVRRIRRIDVDGGTGVTQIERQVLDLARGYFARQRKEADRQEAGQSPRGNTTTAGTTP